MTAFFLRHLVRPIISLVLIAAQHQMVLADGLESLENFIRTARSGRATFTQVVTPPPRDGQAVRTKSSSGSFAFQRPGRFSFAYTRPFEQRIVADGQTLWLHDLDLNQVTARKQAQVLGSTPAALVASASDLRALQADFTLQAAPEADGLQWVVATPKARDTQLHSVRAGFRSSDKGVTLAVLDMLDSFGQRSVLTFSGFELNPALPAETFVFRPPAGADVLRP
jgi:outer membrane lipoprotein carrier protein